jgi:ADP-ribose pyrophosphatase YjhB (NUDIX family)
MNRPGVGVAGIIIDDDKILLGRRLSIPEKNKWQFPGGHVEPGEDLKSACGREVYEETGLKINKIEPLAFTNEIYWEYQKHYVTLFFTAYVAGGKLEAKEPDKSDEWKWWSKLPEYSSLILPIKNLIDQGHLLSWCNSKPNVSVK